MAEAQVLFVGGPAHGITRAMPSPLYRVRIPYIRYEDRVWTAEPDPSASPVEPYKVAEYEAVCPRPVTVEGGMAFWIVRCVRV